MERPELRIEKATAAHAWDIRGRLRAEDEAECRAASGHSASFEVMRGLERSLLAWAAVREGRTVCVFGVVDASRLTRRGIPWCLGSDEVKKIWVPFSRGSKEYVAKMLEPFDLLENYVDVRNTLSIRWLKWCGFEFDEPGPFGVEGLPFSRFSMTKEGARYV